MTAKARASVSFTLSVITLSSNISSSAASEMAADSRVSAVTVYRGQALVTREARCSLPPGNHRVVLAALPCVADPDSVRASGSGSGDLEIGGVEMRQEFREPELTPEYHQLL